MTLIAAIEIDGQRFLLGDILLSVPGGQPLSIPLSGDIAPLPNDFTYQPAGLQQKVVEISSRCAIAWAGPAFRAAAAVRCLRTLASRGELSEHRIEEVMCEYRGDEGPHRLALVALLERDGLVHLRHANMIEYPLPNSRGMVWLAGSAGGHIEDELETEDIPPSFFERFVTMIVSNLRTPGEIRPLVFSAILQSFLLTLERRNRSTLARNYGGYYETAIVSSDGVFKSDDLVHISTHIPFDEPINRATVKANTTFSKVIRDFAPYSAVLVATPRAGDSKLHFNIFPVADPVNKLGTLDVSEFKPAVRMSNTQTIVWTLTAQLSTANIVDISNIVISDRDSKIILVPNPDGFGMQVDFNEEVKTQIDLFWNLVLERRRLAIRARS